MRFSSARYPRAVLNLERGFCLLRFILHPTSYKTELCSYLSFIDFVLSMACSRLRRWRRSAQLIFGAARLGLAWFDRNQDWCEATLPATSSQVYTSALVVVQSPPRLVPWQHSPGGVGCVTSRDGRSHLALVRPNSMLRKSAGDLTWWRHSLHSRLRAPMSSTPSFSLSLRTLKPHL